MDEVTHRGTRSRIRHALRTSAGLLRARWFAVLVAIAGLQGALVWVLPLLVSLVEWLLRSLGIDGLNLYMFDTVFTSVLGLLVLLVVMVVATSFVLAEVTLFAVGEPVDFTGVLRRTLATLRKGLGPQGLLLVPYLWPVTTPTGCAPSCKGS
ncbi:hypothetical protein GCM10028820_13370 [Tessaracoccus terricola]